jgi:hypothetical protein
LRECPAISAVSACGDMPTGAGADSAAPLAPTLGLTPRPEGGGGAAARRWADADSGGGDSGAAADANSRRSVAGSAAALLSLLAELQKCGGRGTTFETVGADSDAPAAAASAPSGVLPGGLRELEAAVADFDRLQARVFSLHTVAAPVPAAGTADGGLAPAHDAAVVARDAAATAASTALTGRPVSLTREEQAARRWWRESWGACGLW